MINKYIVSNFEQDEIAELIHSIENKYDLETDQYLMDAAFLAQSLPSNLRKKIIEFKYLENNANLVISGFALQDNQIGMTPTHWENRPDPSLTKKEEIFFSLCGALLGDLFGWATQQKGYYIHNILPVKGYEKEQLGSGSETLLWWHTEEAFHEYRADYLGLLCLRNPDQVATTYASIDMIELDPKYKEIYFQPRYYIMPDESHLSKNNSIDEKSDVFSKFEADFSDKIPLSILFGSYDSPYLRIDPFYMGVLDENDVAAKEALDSIIQQIEKSIIDISLEPGEILFVDNFRAVHGRKPFHAKYAGKDRWLKRINIARDIRKSRDSRSSAVSRLIQNKSVEVVGATK